jgi:hypothetical protein
MDMGFPREQVVATLKSANYDENRALESLLGGA